MSTFQTSELQKRADQQADLICELYKRVAALEKQVAQLQRGQPPHLASLERRFKPTINGGPSEPFVETKS